LVPRHWLFRQVVQVTPWWTGQTNTAHKTLLCYKKYKGLPSTDPGLVLSGISNSSLIVATVASLSVALLFRAEY
jgi:hypothetical protein